MSRKRWAVRTVARSDGFLLDEPFFWTERGAYRSIRFHQSTPTYRIYANAGQVLYTMIVQRKEGPPNE